MSELAEKLSRRQKINDGEEAPPSGGIEARRAEGEKGATDAADGELADKLKRQGNLNDGLEVAAKPTSNHGSLYSEFKEFTMKQIKGFRKKFDTYDVGRDGFIDLMELKMMMEKLGAPQTHLGLKTMIREVDEDHDDKISFREFLLIFRKAELGELELEGLILLAQRSEINVSEEGVSGAKNFFEAKANKLNESSRFENEIKKEQEERRQLLEEKSERKKAFKEKAQLFQ